jgi:thiol-disulfide isomerase/thioredoxin
MEVVTIFSKGILPALCKVQRTYLFVFSLFFILPLLASAQHAGKSRCDSLGILPDFRFYNLNGDVFNADSLKKDKRTVLIYFSTSCEFCLSEFIIIKQNIADFGKTDFILVSGEPNSELNRYDSLRQFSYFPQIRIVQDKDHSYHRYYTAHYTPSIHIYDMHRKLIHFSDGKMTKEELINYLKE